MPASRAFDAVLFDFNGVITSSPFEHMAALGEASGVEPERVLELMLGPYDKDTDHGWHRMERGEITVREYGADLYARAATAGLGHLDFSSLAGLIGRLEVRDAVVDRVRRLRVDGYLTGLVTNNVKEASREWRRLVPLDELFDVVIDSCEVGVRKPNPAIYRLALERLGGVRPERAVFLDDAPGNVAGAQRAGLRGILVEDPDTALEALDALLRAS